MKTRFIHIIIVFLLTFQNASAIEQTYSVFCDESESDPELVEINKDDTAANTNNHCSHLSTSVVVISQSSYNTNIRYNANYYVSPIKLFHSIIVQPPIPPPIV